MQRISIYPSRVKPTRKSARHACLSKSFSSSPLCASPPRHCLRSAASNHRCVYMCARANAFATATLNDRDNVAFHARNALADGLLRVGRRLCNHDVSVLERLCLFRPELYKYNIPVLQCAHAYVRVVGWQQWAAVCQPWSHVVEMGMPGLLQSGTTHCRGLDRTQPQDPKHRTQPC